MKKFCLILLLFVLPLQLSWAAASAYCQHEEGKAARHLGHHSHQHKADPQSDAGSPADAEKHAADKSSKGQSHSDCNVCHGIGHAWLPPASGMALGDGASLGVAATSELYVSHIPDAPKRPDWSPLA